MIEFIKNLSLMESFALTLAVLFVGRIIWREIVVIRMYLKLVKKQKQRLEELKENMCKGPHSWIYMDVNGEQTNVCKECYFSPKNDAFIKEEFVKAHLHQLEYEEAKEKNRIRRLGEIASKYDINRHIVNDMYEDIINIRKEFDIEWLDKKIAELFKDTNA